MYLRRLLGAGARFLRCTGAMVHAKTATAAGAGATIGTANTARPSMSGNYEIKVEFIDPTMAAAMEEIFQTDLSNCVELSAGDWAARGLHRRFTEAVLNPLRGLL